MPKKSAPEFNKEEFDAIMAVAKETKDRDPRGLFQLAKACGSATLFRHLSWRLRCADDKASKKLDARNLWFPEHEPVTSDGRSLKDICPYIEETPIVSLSRDLVIPSPWYRSRIAKNFGSIGSGRKWGKWQDDPDNHHVEYWRPIGLAWAHNGNHSIMTGIIRGEGFVVAEASRDITPIYDHVRCDGTGFYRCHDGSLITQVRDVDFAAIFEIGRMMVEAGVSVRPRMGTRSTGQGLPDW